MTGDIMHGWYSAKQAAFFSDDFYRLDGPRPQVLLYEHEDGRHVRVTDVTRTPETTMGWDDVEYVGPVTRYIGPAKARGDG